VPDVVAAVLQHPGQLLPGIGDRPPVIRNGDLRLVGVFLSPEIGHVGAPDVLRVLGGAAVGGVVVGLGQLAVIIEALPL
ncbi:helix-turn-helix domain-containing protein, partial [Dysosmobacter welbionis]